jgi:hypothetical protein
MREAISLFIRWLLHHTTHNHEKTPFRGKGKRLVYGILYYGIQHTVGLLVNL